jgi:hypothetical protein
MTEGDWIKKFDGLDYPGRRKPVNRVTPPAHTEATDWADKPLKYMVNGVEQEFFTIGHLARAIGYSVQSIRAWENTRLLPKSRYRTPTPRRANQPVHITKGRRLWTREQIEGIVRIASEEGVILNKKPPTQRFAFRVQALFNELFNSQSQPQ